MTKNESEPLEDRFGLPKMTTKQEVAISFSLTMLGTLLILSVLVPVHEMIDIGPAFLGIIMVLAGYTFAIESIRELEEEDHFLSRKLMKQN